MRPKTALKYLTIVVGPECIGKIHGIKECLGMYDRMRVLSDG